MDLEGITQNTLANNASGDEEAKQVSWVVSQEPDVIMITSIEDPKSAKELATYTTDAKRRVTSACASNTFETIRRWRKLVGDDNVAFKNLKMVISGRLVRRLCSACKVGYTPDPTQLRKLNMSPDTVGKLYAQRKKPNSRRQGKPRPLHLLPGFGIQEGILGFMKFSH